MQAEIRDLEWPNGRVGSAGKRMQAVDGKQKINLEWPLWGYVPRDWVGGQV